jgi:hypothetical protein
MKQTKLGRSKGPQFNERYGTCDLNVRHPFAERTYPPPPGLLMAESCHIVWPGRAEQDGV